MSGSLSQYQAAATATYGLPPGLLAGIAQRESSGGINTYNPDSGAAGPYGILASTAADPGYGVAPLAPGQVYDPQASTNFAASYLAAQYQRTGSWDSAVRAYSGGTYGLSDLSTGGTMSGTTGTAGPIGSGLMSNGLGLGSLTGSGSSSSSGSSQQSGTLGTVWEILQRAGVVGIGIVLIIVALFAMFWQSRGSVVSLATKAAADAR